MGDEREDMMIDMDGKTKASNKPSVMPHYVDFTPTPPDPS